MSNIHRNVLYIGITADLTARVDEHKELKGSKFTSKYNCTDLLYYEWFENIEHAIAREKQLKNWHNQWKLNLIKDFNPEMKDLYQTII